MIHALCLLAQVDDDARWMDIARRKVDRLLGLTSCKDGFRFLWKGRFRPGETRPVNPEEPAGNRQDGSLLDRYADPKMSTIYSVGALGFGAGLLYRLTGYEPALELSGGLARWALARVFTDRDGRWSIYHFHHSLYALMAVCQYGYAAGDLEVLGQVDRCYRWAREMGDPLIGYYTEWMPGSDLYLQWQQGNSVEICEVADMIVLALYLTRAGIADYWDDVDRWVRNVFTEGQMLDAAFLDKIPDGYFNPRSNPRPHQDADRVAERSVGSFFGWMRANDGIRVMETDQGPKLPERSIMHCCTANGALALYYVWDSIVVRENNEVMVNLLLNRASPWLDVCSYLPVEGKVVLRIKDAPSLAVRIPEWCDPNKVRLDGGNGRVAADVEGRILRVHNIESGDVITLTFDVPERVAHRVIGEIPYKLTMRGSNVVSIDPKGIAYPLYESQPVGEVIKKPRFVPRQSRLMW